MEDVCSDLRRSWRTAQIAFGDDVELLRDARLRECDYGAPMQASHEEMDAVRANHVEAAFEDGESWQEASHRHGALFADLAQDYDSVLLIGHRATYVALEHLCKGVALIDAVSAER